MSDLRDRMEAAPDGTAAGGTARLDYSSIGFVTFDCLGWPVTAIPEGGSTTFIQDLTLAVSGAAGTAVIAAAKMGLTCRTVGGVGDDMMATG